MLIQILFLKGRVKRLEAENKEMKAAIQEMKDKIPQLRPKCPFEWKITGIKEKMDEAIEAQPEEGRISSETFYHLEKYKVQLILYLNGHKCNCSHKKYISIFLKVVQGPDDNEIKWPMPYSNVTFEIGEKVMRQIDSCGNVFEKPISNGDEHGVHQFCKLDKISQEIKNDTLTIVVDIMVDEE